jgi:hypothetical protein
MKQLQPKEVIAITLKTQDVEQRENMTAIH